MNNYTLDLVHLYPENMNIYGDMGNIITIQKRCEWRGIKFNYKAIDSNTPKDRLPTGDIYFMGGGQDDDMFGVYEDLVKNKKDRLVEEAEKGKVFLLICGGFQLFGKYFLDTKGRKQQGLGVLNVETKAPGDTLRDRSLGNIVTKITPYLLSKIRYAYSNKFEDKIVGFENHSGQTFFTDSKYRYTGDVLFGKGNNSRDKIEGAIYKNVFGSYCHGSILPKNPHFADFLITMALEVKYKKRIKLEPLDDEIEWEAHKKMVKRLINQ